MPHTERNSSSEKLDAQAIELVTRLKTCREAFVRWAQKAPLDQRFERTLIALFSAVESTLTEAANAYPLGDNVYLYLNNADDALQLAHGMLGEAGRSEYEAAGLAIYKLYVCLSNGGRIGVEPAPSDAALSLAEECFSSALDRVSRCFNGGKHGYALADLALISDASMAIRRGQEALGSVSFGLRLVERLRALSTRLSVVRAA